RDAGLEVAVVMVAQFRQVGPRRGLVEEADRGLVEQVARVEAVEADGAFQLALHDLHRGGADRQMDRPPGREQSLQQAHGVGRAARTRDRDDEVSGSHQSPNAFFSAASSAFASFFRSSRSFAWYSPCRLMVPEYLYSFNPFATSAQR